MRYILPPNQDSMVISRINISPFSYHSLNMLKTTLDDIADYREDFRKYLGRQYLLTESGRQAIDLILNDLHVKRDDIVTILPSLATNYVSSCVTRTIEKYCKWSMKMEKHTKALFVIHEWGIPHPKIDEICRLGFPVIEDCAYSFASADSCGRLGGRGQYSIYSLPKFFEINFGGIVSGLSRNNDILSQEHLDYIYRVVGPQLKKSTSIIAKRIENWNILKKLFTSVGATPFFELADGMVPGVFMFSPATKVNLEEVKARYCAYGVESTIYYGSNAFYIPCNQSLNKEILEFLFNVYAEML